MGENLVAVLLVELLDKVNGIVGVEVVDLLGDFLGGHGREELEAVVLVELHEHIGSCVLVEQLVEKLGFVELEILV